jgi:hypothetical protein
MIFSLALSFKFIIISSPGIAGNKFGFDRSGRKVVLMRHEKPEKLQ